MKIYCRILLLVLLTVPAVSPVFAVDVRVRVFSKYDLRGAVITDEAGGGEACALKLSGNIIAAGTAGGKIQNVAEIRLFNNAYGRYEIEAAGQKRVIPGRITAVVLKDEKGIVLISTMDIEDYVLCALSSEEDDAIFTPELAKAHAVVIRTFAALNTKRHGSYDLCDLTHCMVFRGVPANEKKWDTPVSATKGMILSGNCAKESAYFSACCGGITENAGEFATGRPGKCGMSIHDVLDGRQLCKGHRYFRWVKTVMDSDIGSALAPFVEEKHPAVTDITITARTLSGRAKQMKFYYRTEGRDRSVVVDANRYFSVFGKKAGWALIPSKYFEVQKSGGTFVFTGRGHGHGVGLCVQGAHELAVMGKSYRQILDFYFPGSGITEIY